MGLLMGGREYFLKEFEGCTNEHNSPFAQDLIYVKESSLDALSHTTTLKLE
jgi:hypothetical protein